MTSLPITETLTGTLALPETGSGPGVLLLGDIAALPLLAERWAEEGYVVLAAAARTPADLAPSLAALRARPELTGGIGLLGFGAGAELAAAAPALDLAAACLLAERLPHLPAFCCPLMLHLGAAANVPPQAGVTIHAYAAFDKPALALAHSRSLALLRKALGPSYDLVALWEEHTRQEFAERDVDATMRTMVAQPYVNHIPTMTGGVGQADLARFYRHHFIPRTPQDTQLIPVSRTIGIDRVVDEMLFCFTHDIEMDWMLPGIPPTGRRVEIPLVAIINFRGSKLYHEHIYWDQASVLVQIGLLDPAGLPVAGIETARKLVDETLPSNQLMARWTQSATD